MSVPYETVEGEPQPLPICHLRLLGPAGGVEVIALVDSGATYCVFPEQAAHDAGIDIDRSARLHIQFGSGQAQGRMVEAYIALGGVRWPAPVFFVERMEFRFALLGRTGVFSQFNEVTFLEKQRTPRVEFRW